ncbi:MAG: hypothetical protein ABI415_01155, partial [Flavitalea sp.]
AEMLPFEFGVAALFIGIKHRFRDISWIILMLVGFAFLADIVYPGMNLRQYAVPAILIILGLLFIFRPKHSGRCYNRNNRFRQKMAEHHARRHPGFQNPYTDQNAGNTNTATIVPDTEGYDKDTFVDVVSVFSGVKKKILSKQFTGGDIVCVFGGAEINLTHADFVSPIVLELTQIFGGAKLIVPANWEIRSEVSAIFGAVDDKRPQPVNPLPEKTIVLKGTVIFGGIEVNSY